MTRVLPRTNFNSSRLIRFLSDLDLASVGEARQSFAERLGQWLDVNNAITLYSALNARAAAAGLAAPAVPGSALAEEVGRVRAGLVAAITGDGAGKARLKWPTPPTGASLDHMADFLPYQRYYAAHQRDMEASVSQLRASARLALAAQSPRLRQLATLDAVLDKALAERERSLLATVPARLERRYERLRRAHQAARAAVGPASATAAETEVKAGADAVALAAAETGAGAEVTLADDVEAWTRPGGWLAVFGQDTRSLLLAELEVRLLPVVGLMEALREALREALSNEVTKQQ